MKIVETIRQYLAPAVIVLAPAIGIYIWVESHFDEMNDRVDSMELHVVKLLDRNNAQVVVSQAAITEAIDRSEEWSSTEHQRNLAHMSQMLMNIGHALGYAERLAHENDHKPEH